MTDISIYEESYRKGFAQFYSNIEDYVVLALLPSYLEREGSSLIYMFKDLIEKTNHHQSGFYLNEYESLTDTLISLDNSGQNVISRRSGHNSDIEYYLSLRLFFETIK